MTGSRVSHVLVAAGLTVAAFVSLLLLVIPALLLAGSGPLATMSLVYSIPEFGFAAIGVAFLVASGRGVAYLDVDWPTPGELAVTVGVTVALAGFNLAAHRAFSSMGVETTTRFRVPAGVDPVVLFAALSVVFFLVVGPTEELFFRGVLQRYLAEELSTPGAYAWTSVFFVSLHLPGIVGQGRGVPQFVLVGGVLFLVSWVLGWLYDRTRNLAAPILAHGLYDALVFAALILQVLP